MKKKYLIIISVLFLATVLSAKPLVYILATGGTIAGTSNSAVSSSYKSGAETINQLLTAVPQINKIATIKGVQIANIGSQAMNNRVWIDLRNKIEQLSKNKKIRGIVITHGTDTLEETAYFLNLTLNVKIPVVIVGAMRNSTSISADGPINIYDAVAVAIDKKSRGKGVLVVMNGEIHGARDVTKTNTTNVATFKSPNSGKLGFVIYGTVNYYLEPLRKHTYKSKFSKGKITLSSLPRVDIIYGHSNMTTDMVTNSVKHGAKGIILAGVGNGNPYPSVEVALAKAAKKGVIVVRSSRVGSGITTIKGEVNDKKDHFITADDLNAQKARILLMLAIQKGENFKEIKKDFLNY